MPYQNVRIFITLFSFLLPFIQVKAQGVYTNFGQNRVQHTRMEWSFLRSENFDTYFYSGGRELANYAAKYAEENLPELEKILDHRLSGKVEIVVYNTHGDFKQGNFSLLEIAQNTGGYTQVVNNKVFVYFNGTRSDFSRQIKEGIALVLLNEILYGGNFQDRIQNAALLSLPEWYLKGLTSYLSKEWDADMDNEMKDGIISGKIKKFNRFYQQNQVFAGHSFWKFMVENYSEKVVSQMIYITRLTRNYESAIYNITDLPLKELQKNWLQYYKDLYAKDEVLRNIPDDEIKIKRRFAQYIQPEIKVSSKGNHLAFVTNKNGKYKIWLYNLNSGKYKKIHKGGLKYHQIEVDKSFPLLSWQPGGDKIGIIYEKKGFVHFKVKDIVNNQTTNIKLTKFDKVTGFDFSSNGRNVVFSAIRKGQSDIFIYDLNSRKEKQITRDVFDDLQPRYADFGSKIVFTSNRNTDSLNTPVNSQNIYPAFDIYQYSLDDEPKLSRLTKINMVNHTNAIQYNNQYIAFLSDYNGIKNRYVSRIEEQYDFTALFIHYHDSLEIPSDTVIFYGSPPFSSNKIVKNNKTIIVDKRIKSIDTVEYTKDVVYTYPLTNYSRNIIAHDLSVQTKTVYDLMLKNKKYYIKKTPLVQNIVAEAKKTETYPTMYRLKTGVASKPFKQGAWVSHSYKYLFEPKNMEVDENVDKEDIEEQIVFDTSTYFFVNDFIDENYKRTPTKLVKKYNLSSANKKTVKIAPPRFYDVTFFADQVVTQLDNSIINTYYQPLTAGGSRLFNQGMNLMFKLGMIDLFEDYRIVGGVRVNTNITDLDYFVSFETLKKTLDHKLMYYRQARSEGFPELLSLRHISQELRYIVNYPFNPASSVRANVFYRIDRETTKASNIATTEVPDVYTNWYGGKLEYVYDNIVPKGLNLMLGTRLKIFWDHYRSWEDKNLLLNAVGFDIRHYEKIHRQIIWCTRFTANHSFGKGKVIYYLGGVENWISPRFNNNISISADEKYVFQALGCNLRGFEQNIRNGNTFTVINTEIRIPIFQYALNQPIRSQFLNHFQVVPFFDIGSAWVGNNPYSEDNTFNQKIIEQGPVKAKVINVRDPLVAGVGGGLRSKILGYFIKFDTAWGIQDAEINKKPVYYLSLGLDF